MYSYLIIFISIVHYQYMYCKTFLYTSIFYSSVHYLCEYVLCLMQNTSVKFSKAFFQEHGQNVSEQKETGQNLSATYSYYTLKWLWHTIKIWVKWYGSIKPWLGESPANIHSLNCAFNLHWINNFYLFSTESLWICWNLFKIGNFDPGWL